MRIGVRTSPLKLKNDFPALMNWLSENGFDSVDLPSVDAALVSRCAELSLLPGSFDLPDIPVLLSPDVSRREVAAAAVKAGLTRAAELGLRTWFVCFVPEDKARSRAENFGIWRTVMPEIVAHAENLGIRLAMEGWPGGAPHYATLGCTPEMWRAMFEAVPSPALGLCFDPSHLVRLGIDYERVMAEFGSRIHHVHGKDCCLGPEEQYLYGRLSQTFGRPALACSEGWWRYCVPGDGEVNWRRVAVMLETLRYDGVVSIELEDGLYMADEEGNRRGLLAAKDHLRQVSR